MNLSKAAELLKPLLAACIATVLLLLLFTLLVFKLELDEGKVTVGILAVYVLACFLGGFLSGRRMGSRKFLWGMAVGLGYFLLLFVMSLAARQGISATPVQIFTTLFICAGSGMLGGMFS